MKERDKEEMFMTNEWAKTIWRCGIFKEDLSKDRNFMEVKELWNKYVDLHETHLQS